MTLTATQAAALIVFLVLALGLWWFFKDREYPHKGPVGGPFDGGLHGHGGDLGGCDSGGADGGCGGDGGSSGGE